MYQFSNANIDSTIHNFSCSSSHAARLTDKVIEHAHASFISTTGTKIVPSKSHSTVFFVSCMSKLIHIAFALLVAWQISPCMSETNYLPSFYRCAGSLHGHTIHVPKSLNCSIPTSDTVSTVKLSMYVPNYEYNILPAWKCRIQKRSVCTNFGFFGSKSVLLDRYYDFAISHSECQSVATKRVWQGQSLVNVKSDLWVTNNSLEMEFSYCCFDFYKSVSNLILEKGHISTYNGDSISSDLGNTGLCHGLSGYCNADGSIIIWDPKLVKPACQFVFKGKYEGKRSGNYILIQYSRRVSDKWFKSYDQRWTMFASRSYVDRSRCSIMV